MSAGWSPYLDAGETLLWEGRPDARLFLLRKADGILIPFSIAWGGFAIFWNAGVWAMSALLFFKLWGLPFLVIGLYMIIGRFFIDQMIRAKTVYALSDRRAFIATSAFGRSMREMTISKHTQLTYLPGNTTTLVLGTPASTRRPNDMRSMGQWHGASGEFAFRAIPDGEAVYRMLRDIQDKDTSA